MPAALTQTVPPGGQPLEGDQLHDGGNTEQKQISRNKILFFLLLELGMHPGT